MLGGLWLGGRVDRRADALRSDRAEDLGRIRDRRAAARQRERLFRRVAERCHLPVDEPSRGRGEEVLHRGKGSVSLEREVPPGRRLLGGELLHESRSEAPRRDEQRLDRDAAQHVLRVDVVVDEDRRPVGPGRLTRLARGHVQRLARESGGEQPEPAESLGSGGVRHHTSSASVQLDA